jgi:hypothetical protein
VATVKTMFKDKTKHGGKAVPKKPTPNEFWMEKYNVEAKRKEISEGAGS